MFCAPHACLVPLDVRVSFARLRGEEYLVHISVPLLALVRFSLLCCSHLDPGSHGVSAFHFPVYVSCAVRYRFVRCHWGSTQKRKHPGFHLDKQEDWSSGCKSLSARQHFVLGQSTCQNRHSFWVTAGKPEGKTAAGVTSQAGARRRDLFLCPSCPRFPSSTLKRLWFLGEGLDGSFCLLCPQFYYLICF